MASYGSVRLIELVKRLNLGTANGSIEWQETDIPTIFMCIFNGPSVQIGSADRDGAYPYLLRVLSDEGNIIESLRSNGDDPWENNDLEELYERARRSATNVDDVIDTILQDLPQIPEPAQTVDGYSDEPPF